MKNVTTTETFLIGLTAVLATPVVFETLERLANTRLFSTIVMRGAAPTR